MSIEAGTIREQQLAASLIVCAQLPRQQRRHHHGIRQLHQFKIRQVRALVDHGHVVMHLRRHEHRALVALRRLVRVQSGVTCRHVAELRDGPRPDVEHLGRLALYVNAADQFVSVGVEGAARRKLVADGVRPAERLRTEAFVFERGLRLDAAEVAPRFLETARHTQPRVAPMRQRPRHAWKMMVTPLAGWQ